MPQSVPQNEEAFIESKYRSQRQALNAERTKCQDELLKNESDIRERYRQLQEALTLEEERAHRRCNTELAQIRDQFTRLRKELFRLNWDAVKLDKQVASFRNIRFSCYVARVFKLWAA